MKIAILDDYQNLALTSADWSGLQNIAEISVFHNTIADEQKVIDRLAAFDVICVMRERTPLSRSIISNLPKLKLIVTTGKKNASIDLKAATDHGVLVCGTESPSTATPELTFALMLNLARHLVDEHNAVRSGGWQTTIGTDLSGSTLGIVGLGRLGEKVARIAQAFGMRICAWSQNLTDERCQNLGVEHAPTLHALLEKSDFVTIHQKLSDRTRNLFGADEFRAMKKSAYLVNTSRGPIIETSALIKALETGEIAGAGLDVYDEEPLPANHPLRSSGHILLSPHLGYVTRGTWDVFYGQTIEAISAWHKGEPIRCLN